MKVALYARVSSEKQAEKDLSIPAQLKAMRNYALTRGWEVVQEFIDEAESARTANRPKFQEMITLAKQKSSPFSAILVWKLSRFARSREDSVLYKALLRKKGIQIISINEQIDDSPSGKLLEGIIEVIDEFYSTNLAHDTVRGMKENAQQGYFNGGYVPYGYELDIVKVNGRNKRKWKVNEQEAEVVKNIFELCVHGLGAKEIVKELNKKGIVNREGKSFGKPHIYYMLKNENYTGTYVWNRKAKGERLKFPNHHPAILDNEKVELVSKLLAERTPKKVHPREIASVHILSGLLFCSKCGSKMVPIGAKSGKFKYYACQNFIKKGKHVCDHKMLNTKKLENFFVETIKERLLTDKNLTEVANILIDELNALKTEKSKTLPQVQKRIDDIDRRLAKLYEHIETGKLDFGDLANRIKQLNADKGALLAEHKEIEDQTGNWNETPLLSKDDIAFYVNDLKETLNEGSIIEQKRFIRSFIKRIDVNHPKVEIEYTMPISIEKKREPLSKEVLSLVENGSRERT